MNSKQLALLSGVSCIAVLATYAWAASQEAAIVKTEEVAAEVAVKVEEVAEPALLCIPMAEASEVSDTAAESSEASTEGKVEAAKTEVALPICDEEGNPPAVESDAAADEEKSEEAAAEPAKTE